MMMCAKEMCDGIRFCVKCGEDDVTDRIEQTKRRWGKTML